MTTTSYVDDDERSTTAALFEGDEGTLDVNQRRALVVLLKQRFISNRTHPAEWKVLTADPTPIRARMHDLFLDLVLDAEREVAYKRQVLPEGGGRPFPTLLYDSPWSREETILLVFLRSKARAEYASGADRAFVDREDMLEFVEQHRPDKATDKASDARRATRGIEALFSAGLLIGRSDADRFEISRAIEALLPVEKLTGLLEWLNGQNSGDTPAPADEQPAAATDEDTTP